MSEEDKKLQSLVLDLRYLESQLNELNSQKEMVIRALLDTETGISAMNGFDTSSSSDVLVPIGGGVFVKGTVPSVDKIILKIGADVLIEKSKEKTLKYLDERVKNLENSVSGLDAQRNVVGKKITEKRESINAILAAQKG